MTADELADHGVSADAALAFVEQTRRDGGALRLLETGLAASITIMSALFLIHSLIAIPALVLGLGLTVQLMRRGIQSTAVIEGLARVRRLPAPYAAALLDDRLVVGSEGTPSSSWASIPVTPAQREHIRTLALPSARLLK